MEKGILYKKDKLKVTYLYDTENGNEIASWEDHELWINNNDNWERYVLSRGILKELAGLIKKKSPTLICKLMNLNKSICSSLDQSGITFSEFETALTEAYREEKG